MSEVVIDANSSKQDPKLIEVGSRVKCYGCPETKTYTGTVQRITDLDADYDSELGRYVGSYPSVYVEFDDGEIDNFPTNWTATGPGDDNAPYRCEDLELI